METLAKLICAAALAAGIARAGEAPGGSLYQDYIARRDAYNAKAAEVRRDFFELPGRSEWKFVIDKHMTPGFALNKPYDGKSHIELSGKTAAFAEKYAMQEIASGVWDVFDDPERYLDLAAIVFAKAGRDAGPNFYGNAFVIDHAQREISPSSFHGFEPSHVMSECREDPSRRLEYIEAIARILADPDIRHENPLETKNLLSILFSYLRAEEAVDTFCDYIFFDMNAAKEYRLQNVDMDVEDDLMGKKTYYSPRFLSRDCLPQFGTKYIPNVLWRFTNASKIERKIGIGGGGIHAILYFWHLMISQPDALKYAEDFRREHISQLNDEQKEALDEIVNFIKEKRYCVDSFLEHSDEIVRTWAPSYGKDTAAEE